MIRVQINYSMHKYCSIVIEEILIANNYEMFILNTLLLLRALNISINPAGPILFPFKSINPIF